jgi:putative membrane protein
LFSIFAHGLSASPGIGLYARQIARLGAAAPEYEALCEMLAASKGKGGNMKINRFFKQFNWRFLLVRILVNAIALAVTAAIVPKIYFVDKSIWNWLLMAFMLGVLNALIKPILQILTLQFLFITYGLVLVVVNTLILLLLSFLFPARFAVTNLLWALVGGLVLGLLSSFLESLLGLTIPIVPDEPPELRHRLEEQARQVDWLAAANSETVPAPQVKATEPLEPERMLPVGEGGQGGEDLERPSGPTLTEAAASAGAGLTEPSTLEPGEEPASGDVAPDGEEGQSPTEEDGAEATGPALTSPADAATAAAAEAAASADTEAAHEPQEQEMEDQS